MRLAPVTIVVAVIAGAVVSVPLSADAAPQSDSVQVLAVNDLHGRLARTAGVDSRLVTAPGPDGVYGAGEGGDIDDVFTHVGGAAHMATLVEQLQTTYRRDAGGSAASFLVGVGDMFGESAPESSAYKEEPTVEVLNALGLDVSVVGNHEFDRGLQELLRLSAATDGQYSDGVTACQGVTPGVDGCFGTGEHGFTGADFPFLAANIISGATGEPILPPYEILSTPRGVRMALIGVVRESTSTSGPPEGLGDVQFLEEADAVNRLLPELQSQGIQAIGVLLHTGGHRAAGDLNGCDAMDGAVVDVNREIDPAVDFIVSADTHAVYNCLLSVPGGEPRLVTQAGAYGQLVTDIRLTLDRRTGDVDRAATYAATNVPVMRVSPDERMQAIVDYWVAGPGNQPAEGAGDAPSEDVGETGLINRPAIGVVILGAVVLGAVAAGGWSWSRRNRPRPRRGPRSGSGTGADDRRGPQPDRRGAPSDADQPAETPPPRS